VVALATVILASHGCAVRAGGLCQATRPSPCGFRRRIEVLETAMRYR
jgi:hypothetical protein